MINDMYSLVESVVGSALLIWGIVTLLNRQILPSLFKAFTEDIDKNETLTYLTAGMFLILGLIVVWVHNDWYWGIEIIVTLLGWVLTIKASLWLLFPKRLARIAKKFAPFVLHPWFRIAYGLVVLLLGLLLLSKYYVEKIILFLS